MSDDSVRGGWITAIVIAVLTASSTPFWVRPIGEAIGLVKPTDTPTPRRDDPRGTPTSTPPTSVPTSSTPTSAPTSGAPAPRMSALMLNTNLHGHDMAAAGMERGSAAICAADCLANDACHGMTFVVHPDVPGGVCWEKSDGAATEPRPGMISAYKIG